MNDDEYAEWVRVGMWSGSSSVCVYTLKSPPFHLKERNAAAHHDQQRQKALMLREG